MTEEWRPVAAYPGYHVSSLGRIRTDDKPQWYMNNGAHLRAAGVEVVDNG
jgi:hypothetical protein